MSSDTEAAYLLEQWVGLDAILSGAARRSSRELLTARTSRYLNERADSAVPSNEPEDEAINRATDNAWLRFCLENCRLLAARHRKEAWAQNILRFCAEAKVTGSPLRAREAVCAEPATTTASAPANSETDHPKAEGESILREALDRLYAITLRTHTTFETSWESIEFDDALEAARSVLAGTPP